MKRNAKTLAMAAIGLGIATPAFATNGDNLIGVGPISRSLGGTGIAAPQDAISAVFSNPAAMCISPSCASPQADIAMTLFMPEVNASVTNSGMTFNGASHDSTYVIPALGLSFPLGGEASRWRFGFAAYGTTGLGVNYRGTAIDQPGYYPSPPLPQPGPLVAGTYTDLSILKIAPSVAYAISPTLSIGLSAHIDYATLDLGSGKKNDLGFGAQLGVVWKPVESLSLGLTYISAQPTTFDTILQSFTDGQFYGLTLEAPQQVGAGIAWTGMDDRLLIELNGRWLNWSDADGYSDFDWDDEWVIGIGVQYEVIPQKLWLRAGYNYGTNPVNEHNGWNGAADPMRNVQGANIPTNYYETFRTIGFPAVVKHHASIGVGWQISPDLVLNVAYMHAFEEAINESGFGLFGEPMSMGSTLSEDSVDFALTWRY